MHSKIVDLPSMGVSMETFTHVRGCQSFCYYHRFSKCTFQVNKFSITLCYYTYCYSQSFQRENQEQLPGHVIPISFIVSPRRTAFSKHNVAGMKSDIKKRKKSATKYKKKKDSNRDTKSHYPTKLWVSPFI